MAAITLPELANAQGRDTRLHFIDSRIDPTTATPTIDLLGDDNDSLTRAGSRDTTSTRVVTGRNSVTSVLGEQTMTIDPFYFRDNERIGALMMYIDENDLEMDDIRRTYYEAKFDSTGTLIMAFRMNAWIDPHDFGGGADTPDSCIIDMTFDNLKVPMDFEQLADGSFAFTDI